MGSTGSSLNKALGILGGTFDPIHNGHLFIAEHIQKVIGLTQIRFVLNRQPPHRQTPNASILHREQMLQLALADHPDWVLDNQELDRLGPSYSIWTMRSLRQVYPQESLIWIIGWDAWLGLKNWYRWWELSSLVNFAVVDRPGSQSINDSGLHLIHDISVLHSRHYGVNVFCEIPLVDISASDVRDRAGLEQDVSTLLPKPVLNYINEHQLYRMSK